jgi:hypothetical protein
MNCSYCNSQHNEENKICNDCFYYKNLIKCDVCLNGFIDRKEETYIGCDICNSIKETKFCCENCFDIFVRVYQFFHIQKLLNA